MYPPPPAPIFQAAAEARSNKASGSELVTNGKRAARGILQATAPPGQGRCQLRRTCRSRKIGRHPGLNHAVVKIGMDITSRPHHGGDQVNLRDAFKGTGVRSGRGFPSRGVAIGANLHLAAQAFQEKNAHNQNEERRQDSPEHAAGPETAKDRSYRRNDQGQYRIQSGTPRRPAPG